MGLMNPSIRGWSWRGKADPGLANINISKIILSK